LTLPTANKATAIGSCVCGIGRDTRRAWSQKEAEFLRGAIKAIRLAEEADKYYSAGLLKRAIEMYEESLKLFADAYCIQSRLAIQLAELGRHEEAEAHYRRAYELMPDSFGRVESHCFGCERAFDGQRAQTLAEKVFTEFAAKQPNKPQVHYLLGYLRQEQGKAAEAMQHFQTAVKLDPEYLNAWQKIQSLADDVRLPAKEHDRIVLSILRLDPLRPPRPGEFRTRHRPGGIVGCDPERREPQTCDPNRAVSLGGEQGGRGEEGK
jgi:tetratricopeptide (TPR) repeat protein